MVYTTIKDNFFWESADSAVTSVTYYVSDEGGVFFDGRAYKSPDKPLKIDVSRIIRDYLWNYMPDFREFDGDMVMHLDAMRRFFLYVDGNQEEEYVVLLNYTGEWNGENVVLTEGVNGHADPRQKIFITGAYPDGATIVFEEVSGGTSGGTEGGGYSGGTGDSGTTIYVEPTSCSQWVMISNPSSNVYPFYPDVVYRPVDYYVMYNGVLYWVWCRRWTNMPLHGEKPHLYKCVSQY